VEIEPKIVASLDKYVHSRHELLAAIKAGESNRDPLTELAEVIVKQRLNADKAQNRNQKGWDLKLSGGSTVEVKSVSNRSCQFKNGVAITFPPMSSDKHHDQVAVVTIVDFQPQMILVFTENSAEQCFLDKSLNERKIDAAKHEKFVLTEGNLRDIWNEKLDFSQYSVKVIPLLWKTRP
jgi:hypothetical protein